MADKSTENQTVTLHYGSKDWFVTVCGLNGQGLIPGHTLTEAHVSKQECVDMFGDKKSNNGYRISRNPDFIDRVNWLWKRIHQVDKPVNNDVGLHFCQGLLYEHKHGLGKVDWAELAVTTVQWYRTSKGLKKVHDNWAFAFPSYTIDVLTRQPVGPVDLQNNSCYFGHGAATFPETPSSPAGPRIAAEKAPITLATGDVKRRKLDGPHSESKSIKDMKKSNTNGGRVKVEYIKSQFPDVAKTTHKKDLQNVEAHRIADVEEQDIPDVESNDILPPICEVAPKPYKGSRVTTPACSASFLKALQVFKGDIHEAVDARIELLEEEKMKLQTVMDDARHDLDVATATVKNLVEELDIAKAKLDSKTTKYNGIEHEWHRQDEALTEKCQAQLLLKTYLSLENEKNNSRDVVDN